MVTEVFGELTENETLMLADYFTGQYSDGWGEGFEQHEIKTDDAGIYVSFWDSNNYFIRSEQEFKQDIELKINSDIQKMGGI